MPSIDGNPEHRLKDTFTSPYPTEDSEWDSLMTAIANEFDELETVRGEVLASKFVDEATGEQLVKLASIFQIEKDASWSVAEFRSRIKVGLRSQLASGTVDEIEEVVSVLLDLPVEDIKVVETTDLEPATIQLDVPDQNVVTDSVLADVADTVTAVGIDVGLRVVLEPDDQLALGDDAVIDFPIADEELALQDEVVIDFPIAEEGLGLADASEVDYPTSDDQTALADASNASFDVEQQSFWDEGRWNLDWYDTRLFEISLAADTDQPTLADATELDYPTADDQLAGSDDASLEFEQVTDSFWDEGTWNTSTDVWA